MTSSGKLLISTFASFGLTVALLELSLPLLRTRHAIHFKKTITPSNLKPEEARHFLTSKKFDPDLGWDKDPIARNYVDEKRYVAQSYGDSFVEGAEVGPGDTWQAHFERLTGKAILNLGIGGYGLDQAVLKFEKYGRHYPTGIAILGLYHQMFRRALSYYSLYYFKSDAYTFAFKPIFVKKHGRFELIRPPCTDEVCLMKVLSNPDHEVWRQLELYDYWYQDNLKKPAPGFPHIIKYAQVLPQILRNRREQQQGTENYVFVNNDSLYVVQYLIERFVKHSKEIGLTPVCLLLYSPSDLRGIKADIRHDRKLLTFLEAKQIRYVDTAKDILESYDGDSQFNLLKAPNGHLNGRGNRMVAEALAKELY